MLAISHTFVRTSLNYAQAFEVRSNAYYSGWMLLNCKLSKPQKDDVESICERLVYAIQDMDNLIFGQDSKNTLFSHGIIIPNKK